MSAWPTLAGLSVEVSRTSEYRTTASETDSGKKVKSSRWTTPIYHYHLTYNFLRAADLTSLLSAFDGIKGQFGTATYTDPIAGGSVTVTSESDELEIRRIASGLYSAELDLVTVK